jgi:hypothetical protein
MMFALTIAVVLWCVLPTSVFIACVLFAGMCLVATGLAAYS